MNEPTVTVSVSRKVNCGNYESADVFVSLTIPIGSDQETIDAGLDTGALMYKSIAAKVNEKVKELKHPIRPPAVQTHDNGKYPSDNDSAYEGNYSTLT